MNRIQGFAAALLLALPVAALADIKSPAVSGFTEVRLAVPGKMEVIQSGTESLTVEGSAEDLAKIEIVVEEGVLQIRKLDKTSWSWNPKLRFTVNVKDLKRLAISGSGDIMAKSLKAGEIKFAISGSGDIAVPALEADSTTVAISGSGHVNLAGRTGTLTSSISGSGDVKAEKLEARNVNVHISGAGDVKVWAREALKVQVAGSGDVRYYGDPTVEKRIAGSGSVKRLGANPA